MDWLKLINHVSPENVISDAVVKAKTLLVPEMSRYVMTGCQTVQVVADFRFCMSYRCSFPYPVQLDWLANKALTFNPYAGVASAASSAAPVLPVLPVAAGAAVSNSTSTVTHVTHLASIPATAAATAAVAVAGNITVSAVAYVGDNTNTTTPVTAVTAVKPRKMILVQRSRTRKVSNQEEVRTIVQAFAVQHQYELSLQDENRLPSLREQITRFAESELVVMPHGAGGIFIAFSPENACVIEFLDKNTWNVCYTRVAYIRKLNYISHMQGPNFHIDAELLKQSLDKCYGVLRAV